MSEEFELSQCVKLSNEPAIWPQFRTFEMFPESDTPAEFILDNIPAQRRVCIEFGNDGLELTLVNCENVLKMVVPFEQWVHLKEAFEWLTEEQPKS